MFGGFWCRNDPYQIKILCVALCNLPGPDEGKEFQGKGVVKESTYLRMRRERPDPSPSQRDRVCRPQDSSDLVLLGKLERVFAARFHGHKVSLPLSRVPSVTVLLLLLLLTMLHLGMSGPDRGVSVVETCGLLDRWFSLVRGLHDLLRTFLLFLLRRFPLTLFSSFPLEPRLPPVLSLTRPSLLTESESRKVSWAAPGRKRLMNMKFVSLLSNFLNDLSFYLFVRHENPQIHLSKF